MYSVLDGCSEALGVNTGIFEKRRGNIMVLLFAFAVPRIKRQIIQIFFFRLLHNNNDKSYFFSV